MPTLLGKVALRVIYKEKNLSYPWVSYFAMGGLTLFGWALVINYVLLPFFPSLSFPIVFFIVLIVLGAVSILSSLTSLTRFSYSVLKQYLQPVLLSVMLGTIVFYLWYLKSPYPLNWDFGEHKTLINTILGGRFSFVTSQISDTFVFNGYSSILHLLLSATQMLLRVPAIELWNSLSFIHLILVIFASYLLAYVVTENDMISQLSAFFGGFVFETLTFTSLFFIPQTFTAVVFIFVFSQLIKEAKHNRLPSAGLVFFQSLFLLLNHYVIGSLAVAVYVGTYLFIRFRHELAQRLNKSLLIELGLIAAVLGVLFSSLIPLSFLNQGEGAFYNITLLEKFSFMQRAYGYSMLIFFPFGVYAVLQRKKRVELIALVIAIVILVLALVQVPYVFKFYVLGRFFIHLILAFGVMVFLEKIKNTFLGNVAVIGLVVALMGIFVANSVYWKSILYYHDLLTHISPNEVQASQFLAEKYAGKDVLLVSDPATQNILEALSGVNSQGGAYATVGTREKLIGIADNSNTADVAGKLYSINDTLLPTSGKRLFVLSGRYFQWQAASRENKLAFYFNIWTPSDFTFENEKYIRLLNADSSRFALVYKNPTVAIFEINR